jgi:hypothetical protein
MYLDQVLNDEGFRMAINLIKGKITVFCIIPNKVETAQ